MLRKVITIGLLREVIKHVQLTVTINSQLADLVQTDNTINTKLLILSYLGAAQMKGLARMYMWTPRMDE